MSHRVLYTGGTFDLLHYGHLNFLKMCKQIADEVVVSLNTDSFVGQYKCKTVLNYEERRLSLLHCQYVDRVVENSFGADSKPSILNVNPDIIAIGDDWATKDYYSQMGFTQEWLNSNEIVLVYIPYTKDISSSDIKNRIIKDGKAKCCN